MHSKAVLDVFKAYKRGSEIGTPPIAACFAAAMLVIPVAIGSLPLLFEFYNHLQPPRAIALLLPLFA